ncbi:hypothetical protein, partial [Candidatus Ichthyocystis hellenicum]|uniref:hypothetical protein n=1 Tax=Candidatus Ichthyocystis hellenicum TaxID=1561003 RepID=UPI001111BFB0
MERKFSSTSNGANGSGGNDELGSVDGQEQPSSALELEQSAGSAEIGGFPLAPHLAQTLGMQPGERLFQSMFYGTPQASLVLSLALQLMEKHEVLVHKEVGEGTSSAVRIRDDGYNLALIASSEDTIRALLDSIEKPRFGVVPEVVVEGVGTTVGQELSAPEAEVVAVEGVDIMHGQVTGVPEQSTRGSDVGVLLTPDLALELGMQPDQVLRRGMFYGTQQAHVVLNLVSQLLTVQDDLLIRVLGEGTTEGDCGSVIRDAEYNSVMIQALMDSIESPTVLVPSVEAVPLMESLPLAE